MRRAAMIAAAMLLAGPALAGQVLAELAPEPSTVSGRAGQRTTVTVLTMERPGITSQRYAVQGRVQYRGVEGQGLLETWNFFKGGSQRYYSRTLGEGTLAPLEGASDWRAFSLPFAIVGDDLPAPERIVLNVVLPGRGTVELDAVHLVQFTDLEDPTAAPGQWWGGAQAGLIGGIGGALLGCLGGLLGWLSSRGRARRLVLGLMRLLIVLGLVCLALGLFAALDGQPYAVYYPLLLLGGIMVLVLGGLFRATRRRFEELELRRMRAQDA